METDNLIKQKAFNWSVDYKPFEENLTPQEYARYGFEEGYRICLNDKEKEGIVNIQNEK